MAKFTFIDLFAGIGGMRIAFQKAGAECVFSSEWDLACQKTYKENFGETPYGDITQKTVKERIPKGYNILLAGFPCQPFSSIGKREGFKHATQGTLFHDIAEIIETTSPDALLLENVPGLLTHNGGETFNTIMGILVEELKYEIFYNILDAADYGVPQERKRIYLVGFNKDKDWSKDKEIAFKFPIKCRKRVGIGKFIEKDVKGYSISKHLQNAYLYKVDDGRPQVINEKSDKPVKTLVSTYHKIQRLTGTFVEGGETGLRLLTRNECRDIMGFPKRFKIPEFVSRTQIYRQFGNSVAVPVVGKIAKAMIKKLEEFING